MNALVAGSCTFNDVDVGTCDLAAIGWPGAAVCIVLTLAAVAIVVAFIVGASK
jgi:hypothetical protein